ncbi:hypothetical protein [Paremcibacter congregatus]|uniref:hypothetical protein n=1 Tax=Paremcibacter congregatus TaxID=2043170 RepID=UPI0030EE5CBF
MTSITPARPRLSLYLAGVMALLSPTLAFAGEWDFSGSVAGELRLFPSAPAYMNQEKMTLSPSVALEMELVYEWNDAADRLTFVPFARLDADDQNRSHYDVREAKWLHLGDGWDFVVGLDKVYWGVTESRHLVNIINQDDAVEDLDGEDKLGQPMINFNLEKDFGTFSVFVLPGFREREFVKQNHRLSGPVRIDASRATFEADSGNEHVDFAARWKHVFGDWDVGLSHFYGTSREARLIPIQVDGETILAPHYDQINQTSLDVQYTSGATLWKGELMSRSGQGDRFWAFVAGLEHTLYGLLGGRADLGLLVEYLYDDRDPLHAPVTTADHDIFAGMRLALNDTQDTSVLFGGIVDHDNGSTLLSIEAERRLSPNWKVELEGRFFVNIDAADPSHILARDDFLTLRLLRYF